MLNVDRVLRFPANQKLQPVKATLSDRPPACVNRLMTMVPILGRTNPENVPVAEHVIQSLIDAPPPDDDGGHKHPNNPPVDELEYRVITNTPRRQAARVRLRRWRESALLRDRQIVEEIRRNTQRRLSGESERNLHHDLMALLRDMAGNVSSAA
jgi:hypothetical protein